VIPLAIPNLAGNEAAYLQECVDSNFVSTVGPFVDRFEQQLVEILGVEHAIATSSGTTGLHAALVAVGVAHQDLVILPALTFIASANAIAHCGATPWLVDIDLDSWTLCAEALERALAAETESVSGVRTHRATGRRVAAIMPVHTLGLPADMDPIVEVAREFGLPVVADGAACLGATYRGRSIASTGADLTVFSFNGNKTITAGGGGAIVGAESPLCDLVRHLTTTARTSTDYEHDRVGFNYRLTNLQAAVGCAQLEQLDTFVSAKRRIAARYDRELADLDGVEPFPKPDWGESACWLSGAVIRGRDRQDIIERLEKADIQARPFWRPISSQPPYRDSPCQLTPNCDSTWPYILTLPCSTNLSERDQGRVIEALRRCLE
jgi:perosamine synthetase